MILYVTWLTASIALGTLGVWIARQYAIKMDWLDHPNERSFHDLPTPRIGGWGLLLPVICCTVVILIIPDMALTRGILAIVLPALGVAILSFLDDRFGLSWLLRLGMHFIFAGTVLWLLRETWVGGQLPIVGSSLPVWLCALLLMVWIAGLTNAYNFMDGIDGIAGVQAIVTLCGWLYVIGTDSTLISPDNSLFILILATLGGCLGFLVFNFPPASIFIGDTGSTYLGFFAACLPLGFTFMGMPLESALEAAVLFTWPFVFDTGTTFIRRLILREPVFDAHRSHLYQRFAATFKNRNTGHLLTSLLFGTLSVLGIGLYRMNSPLWTKLVTIGAVWVFVIVWTYLRTRSVNVQDQPHGLPFKPVSDNLNFDIFLSPPHISHLEYKAVREALDSGYIAPVGPQLVAFEEALSRHLGFPELQAVNSGTAAIHLGLRALGVKAGDCVICPDLTFIASCNPVRYLGAEPVLVDVSPDTWAIDVECLKDTIQTLKSEGRAIQAIIVVHALGIPAPMHEILEIAKTEQIKVLEDCAGALGTKINGKSVGLIGDAAAFSFNGNKVLTTGGGGALYIRQPELRPVARNWANQGKRPGVVGYDHESIGYNYKLSNVSAAIGLAQLQSVDQRLKRKKQLFDLYSDCLSRSVSVISMPQPEYGECNFWLSNFGFTGEADAKGILNSLRTANIEASPLWKPMHEQDINKDLRFFGTGSSSLIHRNFLSLPSGTRMTDSQVKQVCRVINQYLQVA